MRRCRLTTLTLYMENTAATRVSARLGFEASDPVLMETQRSRAAQAPPRHGLLCHRASEGTGVHEALIDCDLEGEGYQRRVHFSAEPDQIWVADEEEEDDDDEDAFDEFVDGDEFDEFEEEDEEEEEEDFDFEKFDRVEERRRERGGGR